MLLQLATQVVIHASGNSVMRLSLRLDVVVSRLLMVKKSFPANGNGYQFSRDWQALYTIFPHIISLWVLLGLLTFSESSVTMALDVRFSYVTETR